MRRVALGILAAQTVSAALVAALCGFLGGAEVHAQTRAIKFVGLIVPEISVGESAHHRTRDVRVQLTGVQPTGTVTVTVTMADTTVATVTPATLTFTAATWNQIQTITVSAVDDDSHNPGRRTQIDFAASGGGWDGVTRTLRVKITDNDRVDLNQSYTRALRETAGLGVAKGSLALWSKPTGTVTVTVTVDDPTVVKLSPTTYRFTPSNWNEPQEVTWTPVDDDIANEKRYRKTTVTFTATGANFEGVSRAVSVFIVDDDLHPRTIPEGGIWTRTLRYATRSGETRVLRITSSHPDVVTVSPSRLVWKDPGNSGTSQRFTVTAVENNRLGDEKATVTFEWENRDERPVFPPHIISVTDNDAGGVNVTPTALSVAYGRGAFYAVSLGARPNGKVTVTATSGDTGVATAHSGQQEGGKSVTLEFGPRSWNRPQSVAVYGQGEGTTTFTHTVSGGGYDGVSAPSVAVTVTDLPTIRLSAEPNSVPEGEPIKVTATMSRALSKEVTIPLRLTDGTAESDDHGSAGSITIPAGKTTSKLTITTFVDQDGDDETFTVALGSLSADVTPGDPPSVELVIQDGGGVPPPPPGTPPPGTPPPETPPTVSLSARPNPHVTEGVPFVVTVTLSRALDRSVTIPLTLTDVTAESDDHGTLSGITIPAGQISREETLTTTEDADRDDETFTVALSALPAAVTKGEPSSVAMTILDDDVYTVAVADATVREGAPLRFTVTVQPAASEALTLTWTAASGTARAGQDYTGPTTGRVTVPAGTGRATVTVATVDDRIDEDTETLTVTLTDLPDRTHFARGGDTATGTIQDDDTAGIELSVATLRLPAAIGTGRWTVRLLSQPTAPVTVTVTSSTPAVVTGAPARFTFTPATWDTPQPVTATAQVAGEATLRHRTTSTDGSYANLTQTLVVQVEANLQAICAAWLARFGRTTTDQVLAGITTRLTAPRTPGLTGSMAGLFMASAPARAAGDPRRSTRQPPPTRSFRDLFDGTAFTFTSDPTATGASYALWGQSNWARFAGQADAGAVNGDLLTGTVGVDRAQGPWILGLALSHTRGAGDAHEARRSEDIDSILTLLTPYASLALTDRLTLWSSFGYGRGTLTCPAACDGEADTDTTLWLATGGLRGTLVTPGPTGGLAATLRSDVRFLRATAEPVPQLPAIQAEVVLLRLGLDTAWHQPIAADGRLIPRFSVGLRQDAGDAETGLGLDLGGGLRWEVPVRGFTLDLAVQRLIIHADQDFDTWGGTAFLQWDPTPTTAAGPTLTLRQTYGEPSTGGNLAFGTDPMLATSGSDPTWVGKSEVSGTGSVRATPRPNSPTMNLSAELGWGFPLPNRLGVSIPTLAYRWAPTSRDVSLGWRLQPPHPRAWGLELTATQREASRTAPVHGVTLSLTRTW